MTLIEIGDRIRERRKDRGYSQAELAEMANLNYVTISKYESGKVEPGAKALARIAAALGTTADELLGLHIPADGNDMGVLRERIRRDPEVRTLFSAIDKATPEHLRTVAAVLKALQPDAFPPDDVQEFPDEVP